VRDSAVKGPKFRPQAKKGPQHFFVGPGKSGAELLADLSKNDRKGEELFVVKFWH
jgi:hypothetical protein